MSGQSRGNERWPEIASGLADGIETGRYASGEPLGTVEELALICMAGRRAMRRALVGLAVNGYVVRRERWHIGDSPPLRQFSS